MPRRGQVAVRAITPDPMYKSELAGRIINKVMVSGKKSLAQGTVYDALAQVREKSGKDPLEVLEAAVKNAMPMVEVKARRVGGSNYQVPVEVRPARRLSLAIRWLIQFARQRGERGAAQRLAGELMDAANGQGGAVKKKEDTHRMAEANKAFSHYRW